MVGRLDGVTRTPQGGIRATANLTRVGVFTYYDAAGKPTRELRHPDDIFKSDALDSLKAATLTIGHPGRVTPKTYKGVAVGHVGDDVRADGRFVKATVYVQDAEGVAFVEKQLSEGKGVELSCGYECDVEKTDGDFDGEKYDARQVGHRYNHVALGPEGWGRAGSEVRLTLDDAGNVRADSYAPVDMTKTDDMKDAQAKMDAITGERDALKGQVDSLTAENAKLRSDLAQAIDIAGKKIDSADIGKMVAARVSLESGARQILGADAKFDGKSDRDVMTAAIEKTLAPGVKFDGKSDDYVRARFDALVEHAAKSDAAVAGLASALVPAAKVDGTTVDPALGAGKKSRLDEAREKFDAEIAKSRVAGAPAGALTRK